MFSCLSEHRRPPFGRVHPVGRLVAVLTGQPPRIERRHGAVEIDALGSVFVSGSEEERLRRMTLRDLPVPVYRLVP